MFEVAELVAAMAEGVDVVVAEFAEEVATTTLEVLVA